MFINKYILPLGIIFNKDEESNIKDFEEKGKDKIALWIVFSIICNLIPLIISFIFSIFLNGPSKFLWFLNNGSLPIVSYGIIISSVLFLLDTTKPPFETLKKKTLGIAIILLFMNISLFVFLTSNQDKQFSNIKLIALFSLSLLMFIYTYKISKIMIVMQKDNINYGDSLIKTRDKVKDIESKQNDEDINYG